MLGTLPHDERCHMAIERSLVMIKPDGVQRGLIGEVLGRIERKGFRIVALEMRMMSKELAAKHYDEHVGKDFYEPLVEFMMSGPLVVAVIEGENAIAEWRDMMGPTNPANAPAGTIRADFATNTRANVTHGSDSVASANREIGIWFPGL